jgi:hypothetical protein
MTEPTLETLTRRLDRLEREVRRWKVVASCAVAVLGLAVILWPAAAALQDVQEQIVAKEIMANEVLAARFAVADKGGKRRGAFSLLQDGSVGLSISAPDGKTASLSGDAGGRTGVVLYDKDRHLRAEMYLGHDGAPRLSFYDGNGKAIWKAP